MSRPHEPAKRRVLARQAVEVLRHEGLEISMTRLAQVLEVKRPTLLYHFPTRAEVILAALEDLLTEQASFVLERIAAHEHPIDRLYARVTAVHEFHHEREARIVFLSQAVAAMGQERLETFLAAGDAVFEMHRKAQETLVEEGIAEGIVHPCDVDALMTLIRSVTDGLLVQRVMMDISLAPVHRFLWERVLLPLKRTETPPRKLKNGKTLS